MTRPTFRRPFVKVTYDNIGSIEFVLNQDSRWTFNGTYTLRVTEDCRIIYQRRFEDYKEAKKVADKFDTALLAKSLCGGIGGSVLDEVIESGIAI